MRPAGSDVNHSKRSLVIGVTGHRPEGLSTVDLACLRARIEEILHTIAAACESPILLSPLAEGADRIVATIALDLGLQLHCILPFSRVDYALDFSTSASRDEYYRLLDRAFSVVELDGSARSNHERNAAYAKAGTYTVLHSNVLLAVWDGRPARGEGGSGDVVECALRSGRPVIWVKPDGLVSARIIVESSSGNTEEHPLTELRSFL